MSSFTELEIKIVEHLRSTGGIASVAEICQVLTVDHSAMIRAAASLEAKKLVTVSRSKETRLSLSEEGKDCASHGLPERRLVSALAELGGNSSLRELFLRAGMSVDMSNIGLGWLIRNGWAQLRQENESKTVNLVKSPSETKEEALLRIVNEAQELPATSLSKEQSLAVQELTKRGLMLEHSRAAVHLALNEVGFNFKLPGPVSEISVLTSSMIASGKWVDMKLKEYDVTAQPPIIHPGKKHFYLEFLESVRSLLLSMGFEEAEGSYVETEFWNFDVLFQAQDHPAREIHDSYKVRGNRKGALPKAELLRNVKETHENGWKTGSTGWRYRWDQNVSRRLVLRTQTTAVSMRYLVTHKTPPTKMFCISRVFRPDILDSRHAMEFSQCEGIVMDKGLNFKHLLGFLSDFAKGLDLGDVIFRPGYFPFTEPSVESFVKHPLLGWIEFVGAGMFRPEVLMPLGIKCPVLAWGIGIDRLAMTKLELDDIRDITSQRLDFLRQK